MTSLLQVVRPGGEAAAPGNRPPSRGPAAGQATLAGSRRVSSPWLVRGIVVVAVVAFAGLAVGPHVLGYRTMTMLTASMSPVHRPGRRHRRDAAGGLGGHRGNGDHVPHPDRRAPARHPPGRLGGARHRRQRHRADQGRQQRRRSTPGRRPWKATPPTRFARSSRRSGTRSTRPHPRRRHDPRLRRPALVAGWLILAIWRPKKQEEDRA